MSKAHVFGSEERSQDVQINEEINFEGLILSDRTLKGLTAFGFERPSPIQLVAIPLGKCGFDLIAEAKSGTGKTVMFGVIALEMVELPSKSLQVMILAPTREIAAQVGDVLNNIGHGYEDLKVGVFIGGLPIEEDRRRAKNCHIAIGTPGRLKHLIDDQLLDVTHVRLFVIDEADKLMEPSFEPDISHIFKSLPLNKQVVASSATYTPELKSFLEDYMRSPIRVNPEQTNPDKSVAVLLGVRQIAALVPFHPNYLTKFKHKLDALVAILSSVPFKQCIVFNNSHGVAQTISETLNSKGWPTEFISSSMDQPTRLRVVNKFLEYKCRVLLSTDLVSRGIDVANVNLVVNLDVPMTSATYLHRVGRSGRFGTQGLAITIVESESKDLIRLVGITQEINIPMDCTKIFSPVPFTDNLFTCPLPTLLSEVPDLIEEKKITPKQELTEKDSQEECTNGSKSISSSEESDLEDLPDSSDDEEIEADLPKDICKTIEVPPQKVDLPNVSNLEDELSNELAEMHTADALSAKEPTTPQKTANWRQQNHTPPRYNQHKPSPARSLHFSNPPSPNKDFSPRFERPNSSPNKDYSPRFERYSMSPRREYSPQSHRSYSPMSPAMEFSPMSSQHSTPRNEFGNDFQTPYSAEKFVRSFAKFTDESKWIDYTKKPDPNFVHRVQSPAQQQYYQQLFESALNDLMKDIRSYQPPKVEKIHSYDELEFLSKRFDPTAVCNPAFERRNPYFNRKACLLGMSKHLGVACNLAKRHFVFNGGVKKFLQMLADGYCPDESNLPHWEPGADGFKIYREAWVFGNEYVEKRKKEQEEAAQSQNAEPVVAPQFTPKKPIQQRPPHQHLQQPRWPRPAFDGGSICVPAEPSEHHTLKFPPFPVEPGASLAEWKEQVKMTTFMIHYAEYFRMMNKK